MARPGIDNPMGNTVEDVNYINQRGGYDGNNYRGGNQLYQDNRSNLSYGNPNSALQPPPGFSVTNEVINEEKKSKMDDLLMAFMGKTDKFMEESQVRVEKLENTMGVMSVQMKMFEKQLGQLTTVVGNQHQPGQFPSNTTVNPKEQCNAIHLHTEVLAPIAAAAAVPSRWLLKSRIPPSRVLRWVL